MSVQPNTIRSVSTTVRLYANRFPEINWNEYAETKTKQTVNGVINCQSYYIFVYLYKI